MGQTIRMCRSSKQGIKVKGSQGERHLSRTDARYLAMLLLGFQWPRTPLRTVMAGRPQARSEVSGRGELLPCFAEDIRKSMRREQSTLESRYADCVMLERPKRDDFHRILTRENTKNCRGSSSFRYHDFHL